MATQGQQKRHCNHLNKRPGVQTMAKISSEQEQLLVWCQALTQCDKTQTQASFIYSLCFTCQYVMLKGSSPTTQLQASVKSGCTRHGAERPHSDQLQKKPLWFLKVLLPAGVEGGNSSAVQDTVIRSPANSHHRSLHYVTVCSTREVSHNNAWTGLSELQWCIH